MKKLFMIATVMAVLMITMIGCSSGNLDFTKERAEQTWEDQGFKITGYEGFQWGIWGFNSYGGAYVYYRLKKNPDNGIIYSGCLQRWGTEIHTYEVRAIDAIKP